MATRIQFDTLRSLDYSGISGTYAAVGSAFTVRPRIICISNNTDANMIFSDDSTNSAGKLYLVKGTYRLFDITTNSNPNCDDTCTLPMSLTEIRDL